MPLAKPRSTMFPARLAILLAACGIATLPLAAQLARLTIAKGSDLRAEAEQALVSRAWIPTQRGRILDRHGRVLAKDRPSFNIAVDFEIIQGGQAWARTRAGRVARQLHRQRWPELAPDQRRQLIDQYVPPFQEHVDAMWARLAELTRVQPDHLARRRDDIVRDVERRFSAIYRSRLSQEVQAQLAMGREITEQIESAAHRRAGRDIEEQRAPHVVVQGVDDALAFELQRLIQGRATVVVRDPAGQQVAIDVPAMPGVAVIPAGDREYPLDEITVDINPATLPAPLRAAAPKAITVEGVAYHVLGRMRPRATLEDNQRRQQRLDADPAFAQRVLTPPGTPALPIAIDRGRYDDTDSTGLGGIEEAQEDALRGLRGLVVEQRETQERLELAPVHGQDVTLTIDIHLQARVQAVMAPELGLAMAQPWHNPRGRENPTTPLGTPLHGAAVVIDVDSGDILALVSTPSIPRRLLRDAPEAVFGDLRNRELLVPWIDRAVQRPYPPGSIAKALILNGAVTLAGFNLQQPISCSGHLYPDRPDMFRCWIFKQFNTTHDAYFGHAPNAEESMMVSCNIYYFTLGQRLGPQGIARTFQLFGLGQPMGIGLERPGQTFVEFPGFLGTDPSGAPASAVRPGRISPSDAVQMGIGQGPVAWTPLHAADAYATIARGGVRIHPRIVATASAPKAEDLGLDPAAVRATLQGLHLAVADPRGTGHHIAYEDGTREAHFNAPGVKIWGKTGTATAPTILTPPELGPGHPLFDNAIDPIVIASLPDSTGFRAPPGRRVLRSGDHSWFVVLVGPLADPRPRFAIAVLMEYAGSGGKVSGPIVNQIIHALIAEGYLPASTGTQG